MDLSPPGDRPERPYLPPELDPRGPRRRADLRAERAAVAREDALAHRRHRRGRLVRTLGWVAGGTSLLVLLVSVVGYALFLHYDGQITRVHDALHLPGHVSPAESGNAVNFLLVGSDSRADAAKTDGVGSTASVGGARSDTAILLHIPKDGSKASLISFPRDSWVHIPEWTAPNGHVIKAHDGKINSSFAEGDLPDGNAALLKATVEDLSGLRIDHYVEINFAGLERVVSALDGVDICTPVRLHDPSGRDANGVGFGTGLDLSPGHHSLDGPTALSFVRARYGVPGGDLGRIANQQQFLGAIVRKVTSRGTLLNPLKLNAFLDTMTKSVRIDDTLSFGDLRDLALRMRHLDPAHVEFATLPVTNPAARRGGQSVVLLDDKALPGFFAALGEAPQPSPSDAATAPTADLVVAPGSVRVSVLNASGASGLAARTSSALRREGFHVVSTGNARAGSTPDGVTTVRHGPSRADSARTLAAAIPGARVVEDDSLGSTVQLLLGGSDVSVVSVSVGSHPQPKATSAATPATAPVTTTAATDPCTA